MSRGQEIVNNPFLNKGTAFTEEERKTLNLQGMLPPRVQTLEEQTARVYKEYLTKSNDLEKRVYLMSIFNENRVLFYATFAEHVSEFMPIVYDPTIADSIENYSRMYVNPQNAAFLSINQDDKETIRQSLINAAEGRNIKLLVVTDGEGILGIGDWGTQGIDIPVGKLMVYSAAAGIDPSEVLPVVIDAGTTRKELLEDPLYLGLDQERDYSEKYYDFVDKFVTEAEDLFPNLYLHFEDFGRANAANILDKYKDKYLVFNDDIQGTGIIVLAGVLGGLNISGEKMVDQKYLCFGAGTAGVGIAQRVAEEMVQSGLSEEEAKKRFYMVDKQGLLFDDMPDLTPGQKEFARSRSEFANSEDLTDLLSVVKAVHPTIMVGTSTVHGAFTEDVIKEMAAHTERPIVMPISNPTKLTEATAADVIKWSDGRALVATGIPSAPVEYNGVTYEIGQANNALVYPGIGLGAIAATATKLSDKMISAAAHSLGGIVDPNQPGAAILPPVDQLTEFSQTVANSVAQTAVDEGITRETITDVKAAVEAEKWYPVYKEVK
ncbi:malolactic enzyme [Fructilactobacillus sanfranciscensis]|uniref:Malolactic enzyme n=2 Tax=Fructilactobacillus sanfranciscensis TaxID=1625 RepID=G2KV78_FRUST|nr:malolactic enzyme [Fructilactobacillus sanfranciscensis]AEN98676.1 Malolactic enzyme [Fructilactobacillus sanfranciscensis TMW 1.1304]KRM80231.1 Malolactic enzyme [Fructilactobacillus sanfranciscensis DSM 20451]MCG7196242.1 NAD-dependent malic enzyme [Fructilactobacillus sanfranciscensis]MVF15976.1 NAD-dependent malic enzyme [Fructilactobacillus sanfranciscensis]NDR60509.1 NAD-dependent malic enzyme [Fructilactobacillus sanfranciscensis]